MGLLIEIKKGPMQQLRTEKEGTSLLFIVVQSKGPITSGENIFTQMLL